MNKTISRIYHSAVVMSWANQMSKVLAQAVILPIMFVKFNEPETNLWLLFLSLFALTNLGDIGFNSSFVRLYSYAYGGAGRKELKSYSDPNKLLSKRTTDWNVLADIYQTSKIIYSLLTLFVFIILAVISFFLFRKPISEISHPLDGYFALTFSIISICFFFIGHIYDTYIQGLQKVADYQRWQGILGFLSIGLSIISIYLFNNIFYLVIAYRCPYILSFFVNKLLLMNILKKLSVPQLKGEYSKLIFDSIWPAAWRTGIGKFTNYGIVEFSGLILAQFSSTLVTSNYLLSVRVLQMIKRFSNVFINSKIPKMALLRSNGQIKALENIVSRSYSNSNWFFVIIFSFIISFAPILFELINSSQYFSKPYLWYLMGIAFFADRFGNNHLQIFNTTNIIVGHKLSAISGIIQILFIFLTYKFLNIYAFPVGIALGYILYFNWNSAKLSYQSLKSNFVDFERRGSLLQTLFLIVILALNILLS